MVPRGRTTRAAVPAKKACSARVLVDQVGAFDVSRFGRRVGRLAHSELREVDEALRIVLGLF